MNKVQSVLFMAGILLALGFTFGCSSNDNSGGDSGGNGSWSSSDSNNWNNNSSSSNKVISSSDGGNSSGNSGLSSSSNNGDNHSSGSVAVISSSDGGSSSGNSSSSSLGQSSSSTLKECDAVFNPDNKFCYDGSVYDKCDGMVYNPTTHICQNGVATPAKCGGVSYNPTTQRCNGSIVQDKCGNYWYNQATQGCCNSVSVYNKTIEFCYNRTVYDKCGGNSYDPLTHGCVAGEVVDTKCGDTWYSQATQFCSDNNILYNKCSNESYNPSAQYCGNGTLKNYDFFIDARDNKKYKETTIGTQTWMAENLNYNGSDSKCYYNSEANCSKYGRLYNWETAMSVCPTGWRLPSNEDWNVLMKFVNPSCSDNKNCAGAGTKLKAMSGWYGYGYGTDDFGFSALPGGSGSFDDVGNFGYWWSASEYGSDGAYYRDMYYHTEDVGYDYHSKLLLRSVRCLQD